LYKTYRSQLKWQTCQVLSFWSSHYGFIYKIMTMSVVEKPYGFLLFENRHLFWGLNWEIMDDSSIYFHWQRDRKCNSVSTVMGYPIRKSNHCIQNRQWVCSLYCMCSWCISSCIWHLWCEYAPGHHTTQNKWGQGENTDSNDIILRYEPAVILCRHKDRGTLNSLWLSIRHL